VIELTGNFILVRVQQQGEDTMEKNKHPPQYQGWHFERSEALEWKTTAGKANYPEDVSGPSRLPIVYP